MGKYKKMRNVIDANSGAPAGFHDGRFIYDHQGRVVGQLRGSSVYCMAGHYVGEFKDGVILEKTFAAGKPGEHVGAAVRQPEVGHRNSY